MDTRPISAMGVLLVALGYFFSCVVYHVTVVTAVLGVVVGLGQGMMYFSSAIIINQYFLKNRVSGNGKYECRKSQNCAFIISFFVSKRVNRSAENRRESDANII